MLCTVPREIRQSKRSRSNSTTARYGLWPINTKARTNCHNQALVTGRWKRTFSVVGSGSKAWVRAAWAVGFDRVVRQQRVAYPRHQRRRHLVGVVARSLQGAGEESLDLFRGRRILRL
jgi:hypothetical protein